MLQANHLTRKKTDPAERAILKKAVIKRNLPACIVSWVLLIGAAMTPFRPLLYLLSPVAFISSMYVVRPLQGRFRRKLSGRKLDFYDESNAGDFRLHADGFSFLQEGREAMIRWQDIRLIRGYKYDTYYDVETAMDFFCEDGATFSFGDPTPGYAWLVRKMAIHLPETADWERHLQGEVFSIYTEAIFNPDKLTPPQMDELERSCASLQFNRAGTAPVFY